MTTVRINCELPPLKKGEVRVMYDDGDGIVAMDFREEGVINKELKSLVQDFLKKARFK